MRGSKGWCLQVVDKFTRAAGRIPQAGIDQWDLPHHIVCPPPAQLQNRKRRHARLFHIDLSPRQPGINRIQEHLVALHVGHENLAAFHLNAPLKSNT